MGFQPNTMQYLHYAQSVLSALQVGKGYPYCSDMSGRQALSLTQKMLEGKPWPVPLEEQGLRGLEKIRK